MIGTFHISVECDMFFNAYCTKYYCRNSSFVSESMVRVSYGNMECFSESYHRSEIYIFNCGGIICCTVHNLNVFVTGFLHNIKCFFKNLQSIHHAPIPFVQNHKDEKAFFADKKSGRFFPPASVISDD